MKYVTHPNIKVVKNVTRVRLHVTEMKSHPGMKKFPFTRAWVSSREETSGISSRDEIWFKRKPPIEYELIY